MYSYYGLSAIPAMRPYLWWKKHITQLQLVGSSSSLWLLLLLVLLASVLKISMYRDWYCIIKVLIIYAPSLAFILCWSSHSYLTPHETFESVDQCCLCGLSGSPSPHASSADPVWVDRLSLPVRCRLALRLPSRVAVLPNKLHAHAGRLFSKFLRSGQLLFHFQRYHLWV